MAAQHLLTTRRIPLWTRPLSRPASSLRSRGAELMGAHNQAQLGKLQSLITTGMKWVAGKSGNSPSVAASTLHREFGIPPIVAYCGGQRYRAARKFKSSLRTWVHDAMNQIPKYKVGYRWTWEKRTNWWVKRYIPGDHASG